MLLLGAALIGAILGVIPGINFIGVMFVIEVLGLNPLLCLILYVTFWCSSTVKEALEPAANGNIDELEGCYSRLKIKAAIRKDWVSLCYHNKAKGLFFGIVIGFIINLPGVALSGSPGILVGLLISAGLLFSIKNFLRLDIEIYQILICVIAIKLLGFLVVSMPVFLAAFFVIPNLLKAASKRGGSRKMAINKLKDYYSNFNPFYDFLSGILTFAIPGFDANTGVALSIGGSPAKILYGFRLRAITEGLGVSLLFFGQHSSKAILTTFAFNVPAAIAFVAIVCCVIVCYLLQDFWYGSYMIASDYISYDSSIYVGIVSTMFSITFLGFLPQFLIVFTVGLGVQKFVSLAQLHKMQSFLFLLFAV